jgi:hypothetical protein
VPASLEKILSNAMSRNPKNRPATVLELVRLFQSVETELGVPQTQIEVAMDDWALATVADLEDKTRVRGVAGALVPSGQRKRRRRPDSQYNSVGTIVRDTNGGGRSSTARPAPNGRMRALVWGLIAIGVLALALGVTAVVVLVNANNGIPVVSDIKATSSGTSVKFSWPDPGLGATDSYTVAIIDGGVSTQKSDQFAVDGTPGQQICLTVSVNRAGRVGSPSNQKCADVGG